MDVILTAIACLIVMGCMDRYLHPRANGRAARARVQRPRSSAHRHSATQVSPFLTSTPFEQVSAHR